jgi:hypothetical protein
MPFPAFSDRGRIEVPSVVAPAPLFLLNPFAWLRTHDEHATSDRLSVSQHVRDLRLVVSVAFAAVLLVLVLGLVLSAESEFASAAAAGKADWVAHHPIHKLFKTASSFLTFFGPVLAVFGTLLAWAYQVGSARLGVVDLFACEITTLCRVATVVDAIGRQLGMFETGPPKVPADLPQAAARPFATQENYFPVFETNSHDLETLEASVVINITAFYTYLKAFRDAQRSLTAMASRPDDQGALPNKTPSEDGPWREAVSNAIYLLFLTLESARLAVDQLVEFNPEKTERTALILINELPAYGFLRGRYKAGDFRRERIMQREAGYRDLRAALHRSIAKGLRDAEILEANARSGPERIRAAELERRWIAAQLLMPELDARFEDATRPVAESRYPAKA